MSHRERTSLSHTKNAHHGLLERNRDGRLEQSTKRYFEAE
jgi:hypothetical protein